MKDANNNKLPDKQIKSENLMKSIYQSWIDLKISFFFRKRTRISREKGLIFCEDASIFIKITQFSSIPEKLKVVGF